MECQFKCRFCTVLQCIHDWMFMFNVWHLPAPFHPHSDILSVFASGSLQIQKLWLTWLDSNKTSRQRSLVFRAFILYLQTYWQNLEINEKHHINFWSAHQSRVMQIVSKTAAKLIILLIDSRCRRGFLHWQCAKGLMEEPNNSCSISFILYGTDGFKNRHPFRC